MSDEPNNCFFTCMMIGLSCGFIRKVLIFIKVAIVYKTTISCPVISSKT